MLGENAEEVSMFPFLIGTVRTHDAGGDSLQSTDVSIPHRYGKNVIALALPYS